MCWIELNKCLSFGFDKLKSNFRGPHDFGFELKIKAYLEMKKIVDLSKYKHINFERYNGGMNRIQLQHLTGNYLPSPRIGRSKKKRKIKEH
jgi:hypothetical protein